MGFTAVGRNHVNGVLRIEDDASHIVDGTFVRAGMNVQSRNPHHKETERGSLLAGYAIRTADEPVTVRFEQAMTQLVGDYVVSPSAGTATLLEIMKNLGSVFTSRGAAGEVYQFKITWTITDPAAGANTEVCTLDRCILDEDSIVENADNNTVSFTVSAMARNLTIERD